MAQALPHTDTDIEIQTPKMARVIMLNDDFTTQEFVVRILKTIFQKNKQDAVRIMLEIHNNGSGICGIYPYDIAQSKAQKAIDEARNELFPLRILVEDDRL